MSRPSDETVPAVPLWVASLDPRLKVLYLLVIAVALFAIHDPQAILALAAAQVVLAAVAGVGTARILRGARKLLGYGAALAVTFAFFPDEGDPRWMHVPVLGAVSLGGLELAGLMMVRIFAVVVASEFVRSGAPSAFAEGLRGLGAPRAFAIAIDVTVALLGPGGGGGGGGGRGGGRGRGRTGEGEHDSEGFGGAMRRLARGDVGPIVGQVERSVDRASHEIERRGDAETSGLSSRDLAVVAGMATAMLGLKILKVLPGIPFAPGHKTVLLIPLYILAGALTTFRWGATLTGATMGTVAFLMGDGRYGVFEILKHVAPGVVVDLGLPWLLAGGRRPGVVAWCLFGLVVAIGRFATVVAMTLAVAAPGEMYVLLAVPGLVHLVFGVLSGFVSYHVVRGLDEIRAATGDEQKG